jgi:hypothetical protein
MNYHDELLKEYLVALDDLVGASGRYLKIPNADAPFWLVAYDDVPEKGSLTAFTFGISFVRHPSWQSGVPEIVISVNSSDDDWLLSLGAIACSMRGKCPFSYGNVLRFGKPLGRETQMSSYFLFWPTILEKDQQQLQLSDRVISFKQAYPIFDSEADAIGRTGAEKLFMMDGVDYSDVSRDKVA